MIQYLLGSLPEAETERLDALSVADTGFAEQLSATEKELVDAYIQGELTGAAEERFKTHYLASPLRREKVEFARAFGDYAKRHAAGRPENAPVARSRPARPVTLSWLEIFKSETWFPRWSLATAAAILLAAGGWWMVNTRSDDGKQFVASYVLAPPLRGAPEVPTLSISTGATEIEMQLELEANDYPAYRVALVEAPDGKDLWRSGELKATIAGDNRRLVFRLPAKLARSQIYLLVVSGIDSAGNAEVISNYPFQALTK